ncbi:MULTISPECIES: hypothetical protein [Pseudomonas syringae group]|uniref:Uncharacterized protein n=1 Tax=Pseudomonas syringae pv. coryli TaxID=317659 RepID=A0A0P9PLN6_9PSED|nr:hypothetical protein [Pseudomonas syringae pv. coryli]KPX11848.1 Unknown protein sequence [Pseudomonas syringae pv. coryli]
MMILVDPRRKLAVQPGDISSMQMVTTPGGRWALELQMISGREIVIPASNDQGSVDLNVVHAQLMEASE